MYSMMDSEFFSSCLYFIVAVIILNFWFLNLLTAVVVNTFKDIRAETKKERIWCHRVSYTSPQVPLKSAARLSREIKGWTQPRQS